MMKMATAAAAGAAAVGVLYAVLRGQLIFQQLT
jgi:hypothetical protein